MSTVESLKLFTPEIVLVIGAFVTLFCDFITRNKRLVGIAGITFLVTTALLTKNPEQPLSLFSGFFVLDSFTHFFRLIALGVVTLTLIVSLRYERIAPYYRSEYYSLFLFMAFGLILMSASTNLLMIFLSIEFVSILSYLLVGFLKKDARSKEASVKYLLFGSVASAIMLYGMSLLYGCSGSLDLNIIRLKAQAGAFSPLLIISLVLILTGIGFKISMAPFHMWAPDVYEGAPTPVTGFLTVAPKALGFAVMIRVLEIGFDDLFAQWSHLIAVLAALTMTLGNLVAVAQTNIKRLLAYSSIAQAGYILMGIAVFSATGLNAVLVYLVAYVFTNLGAFTVVLAVSNHQQDDHLDAYAGLSKRAPLLAACMTIFLLSLAGIPPLAGFIGKFFVFAGAIEAKFYNLALIAAVNSAVAAYYYFKVVRVMYLVEAPNPDPLPQPLSIKIALTILLAGTVLLGVFPTAFIDVVNGAF